MTSKVVIKDRGYSAFKELMRKLTNADPFVTVGIHGDQDSDLINAAIANEYGSGDGRIPERPAHRMAIDESRDWLFDVIEEGLGEVIDGEKSVEDVLSLAGVMAVGEIQGSILSLIDPANADSTIKAKGSSNPLIDTGRTRQSVTFKVNK